MDSSDKVISNNFPIPLNKCSDPRFILSILSSDELIFDFNLNSIVGSSDFEPIVLIYSVDNLIYCCLAGEDSISHNLDSSFSMCRMAFNLDRMLRDKTRTMH